MRLSSIEIQGFKQFLGRRTFSFEDANEYDGLDMTLIVGNNGTGKSSLLQAIVLLTATATKENFSQEDLDWPGFDYRYLQTGQKESLIRGTYAFREDEIQATSEYASELRERGVRLDVPGQYGSVTLDYDFSKNKSFAKEGAEAYYQFMGYQYAKRLSQYVEGKNRLFNHLGDIYWYTEQRTSYSISKGTDTIQPQLDWIRAFLSSAYAFHIALQRGDRRLKEGQFDFYDDLHRLYKAVFPHRSFVGAAPNFNAFEKATVPDFFLSDGKNQYEIAEMSAGERAIFPILMDFARWNINNSIIIIDEVELHLHPPLQQAFIRALGKLGKNNQFIITTHSNTVVSMFEEEQIIRL